MTWRDIPTIRIKNWELPSNRQLLVSTLSTLPTTVAKDRKCRSSIGPSYNSKALGLKEQSISCHAGIGVNLKDPDYNTRPYDKALAYGESKTANSLIAVELDRRGQEHGVRAFSVHPGGVLTDLVRYLTDDELKVWGITRVNGKLVAPPSGYKTPAQGAATSLWCAVSPQLQDKGGVYCEDCDIARLVPNDYAGFDGVRPWATDTQIAKTLWELSETMTIKWPD
jgi:NAD(P)-dependent dehydrogenase (short-subunit alcohol dehydrogenase family)